MPQPPPLPSMSDADYEAIAAAVVETARGRWFLAEHARRNRHADTKVILQAIEKIERTLSERANSKVIEQMRLDLVDMANAIDQTKVEIAAIKPVGKGMGQINAATSELNSVVDTTEKATSDIIAFTERVQEIAWTLREKGIDPAICDLLDAHATETYTACSFQDLTGQRIRKIINILNFLEARIDAMIRIWRLNEIAPSTVPEEKVNLLVGERAKPEEDLGQTAVDDILDSNRSNQIMSIDRSEDAVEMRSETETGTAASARMLLIGAAEEPKIVGQSRIAAPAITSDIRKENPPAPHPIEKLTVIERLALFS